MITGAADLADLVLAVDIGGTKLAAGLVSPAGSILRHNEIATPPSIQGSDCLASALAGLVTDTVRDAMPTAAAIAAAGPLDTVRGVISPVNIPAWRDFDVVSCVSDAACGLPTVLVGDAIAAAAGEAWIGAAAGSSALLGIVVSTGVGGGLVLDGKPFVGPSGNAGHFGHIVVEPGGPVCGCGGHGCIEAIASGPAMLAFARAEGWRGADVPALTQDCEAGSRPAMAAFDRAAEALAAGIAAATVLCDLDMVVVGGGVSAVGEVLLEPMRRKVASRVTLDFAAKTRIVQAGLGRQSGLIGAASIALSTQAERAGAMGAVSSS